MRLQSCWKLNGTTRKTGSVNRAGDQGWMTFCNPFEKLVLR